jgi:hypothetical protein
MPRPKKEKKKIVDTPLQFDKNEEHGLTEMQSSFVWHYTEGACGQSEAARKAGYEFPSQAANKLLNGKDYPNVVKARGVGRKVCDHTTKDWHDVVESYGKCVREWPV